MDIPFSQRYATQEAVKFMQQLAISRVGKGPYVANPTEWDCLRFETWLEIYKDCCAKIIEEDLVVNAPELVH